MCKVRLWKSFLAPRIIFLFVSFAHSVNDYLCGKLLGIFPPLLDLFLNISWTWITSIYQEHMWNSGSYIYIYFYLFFWKSELFREVCYYCLTEHICDIYIYIKAVIWLLSSIMPTRRAVKIVAVLNPSELDVTSFLKMLSSHFKQGFCQPSKFIQMMYYCLLWVSKLAISHAAVKIWTGHYRKGRGNIAIHNTSQ